MKVSVHVTCLDIHQTFRYVTRRCLTYDSVAGALTGANESLSQTEITGLGRPSATLSSLYLTQS